MPEGDGPLRPVTPTVSKRTEDILRHTRLDEGFTATDPEFLVDLTRKTRKSLSMKRAIQSDAYAVPETQGVRVEIQTEGDEEGEIRHRQPRMVPDPSFILPTMEEDEGVKDSHNPLHQLRENNSCLLNEVMHQQAP